MQEITSTKNPVVKKVSSLLCSSRERRREGLFVVEGPRMAREIPVEHLRGLYLTEDFAGSGDGETLIAQGEEISPVLVTEDVMARMSGTEHPQGVLALVSIDAVRTEPAGDFPAVFLEDVQDPGNVGTIIRTAEAAGISAIYMSSGCADILSPKVVRSTMGCLFRMPLIRLEGEAFYEEIERQQEGGRRFVAAALGGSRPYDAIPYDGNTAFLIGNEGNGLSVRALSLADEKTIIPMEGAVESLNASIAAAILMYEASRQRRSGSRS